MYNLDDIRVVHLEVTEKCQAGCPICPRHTNEGLVNPLLVNADMSVSAVRKYFSKPFVKQLTKMYMCGNYGDPIIAKDTLEIFEYFRYNNPSMALDMHTNGGARTSEWWKDLASVLYNEKSQVIFSFDGLSDTNDIYRKNVNWDIALNSAKSFIEAGGNAVWSFLVFRHNEHQVDEARALSEKLGFKKFVAKKSARFKSSYFHPYLEMPTNPEYQNKQLPFINDVDYDTTEIQCMVAAEKSIYVSARGLLFPCCWVGGIYGEHGQQIRSVYGNLDLVDLNKQDIDKIFASGIFNKIERSWSCQSIKEGKLRVCAKTCSKQHNFFKAQFE